MKHHLDFLFHFTSSVLVIAEEIAQNIASICTHPKAAKAAEGRYPHCKSPWCLNESPSLATVPEAQEGAVRRVAVRYRP